MLQTFAYLCVWLQQPQLSAGARGLFRRPFSRMCGSPPLIMKAAIEMFNNSNETTQNELVMEFLTEENFSDDGDEIKEAVAEMF